MIPTTPDKPARPKAIRIREKTIKETGKGGVEDQVKKYAKSRGFYVRKFVSPGNAFVPDDVFVAPGPPGATPEQLAATLYLRLIFPEFKRPGEKATPGQEREHERMRGYGLPVIVIDNVDAGKALVDFYAGRVC